MWRRKSDKPEGVDVGSIQTAGLFLCSVVWLYAGIKIASLFS